MPSPNTFIHKYASTRAFQIPIKLGAVKAHALMDTRAQCSVLSSGLVKRAFIKQSLQLPICDVKLLLKVIASVRPQMELFLNAANDNVLEEIPEEERVSFYDDKPKGIEAEQPIRQAQPSPHQPPSRQLEVTKLAKPIFLVAQ
uniref:Aspartic peptidase DDI1-type domain-containing protein n=1 Tax=Romanomermis culicivorax TaxID=13658 RepID=A0A915I5L7_ROMCU